MPNKQIMKSALMENVVKPLKNQGFEGKYPHYKREKGNCIELITFQTNKYGGSFTVEVSAVFPNETDKKKSNIYFGDNDGKINVWSTKDRYRLPGMFDGWFYYSDVYSYSYKTLFSKRTTMYRDVNEKEAESFIPPEHFTLVQKFDGEIALKICEEVNKQLIDAFEWLEKFESKRR